MATQVSMSNEAFASPYRRRGDMAEKAAGDANQAAREMGENRDRLAGGIGDMYAQ